MNSVSLYGAGGHAYVIMDILKSIGCEIADVYDDNTPCELIGVKKVLPGLQHSNFVQPSTEIIVSIGNNKVRKGISEQLGGPFATAISQNATVSSSVEIGKGSVVMQGAVIQAYSLVGKHSIVNTRASIDHEVKLHDYVHISPAATLCGNVEVGEGAWIGAGAVIIPGVKIGAWSIVGAGAVVIRDVPDQAIVVGNPAKVIAEVC